MGTASSESTPPTPPGMLRELVGSWGLFPALPAGERGSRPAAEPQPLLCSSVDRASLDLVLFSSVYCLHAPPRTHPLSC